MKLFKKIIAWVVFSSQNPRQVSMTFTGIVMAAVPWIMNASSLACGFHVCSGLTQDGLTEIIGVLSDIVFWFLSLIAGFHFVVGFIRKVILTLQGKNQVLQ